MHKAACYMVRYTETFLRVLCQRFRKICLKNYVRIENLMLPGCQTSMQRAWVQWHPSKKEMPVNHPRLCMYILPGCKLASEFHTRNLVTVPSLTAKAVARICGFRCTSVCWVLNGSQWLTPT